MGKKKLIPFQEFTNERINKYKTKIVPFFIKGKMNEPDHVGSGVLLKVSDYYFILTASHVLEFYKDEHNPLFTFFDSEKDFYPITGEAIDINPETNKILNDNIDIGLIHLDSDIYNKFNESDFLSLEDIEIDHDFNDISKYLSMGYPSSKSKVNMGAKNVKGYLQGYYTSKSTAEDYEEYKVNPHTHFLYNYSKKSNGKKLPDPYGISGGGIFCIYNFAENIEKPLVLKLVGINMEHYIITKKEYHLNKAIRIDFITDAIRYLFPKLSRIIPKSKLLKNFKFN